MTYILVLLYTLVLVFRFDIRSNKKTDDTKVLAKRRRSPQKKHTSISKKRDYHLFILLLFSICISGFSYRLGMDTVGYMYYYDNYVDPNLFDTIKNLSDKRYEIIPELLFSICKFITEDFTLVQVIIAIFVNTTIFWFLRKHSPYVFFAIFLFFLFQYWNINFEIKRESISIALFLIAISNLLKKNVVKRDYFKYYFICCIMMLSHHFAFMALFFPLMMLFKISKATISTVLIVGLVGILGTNFSGSLLERFGFLFQYFNTQDVMQEYLASDRYGSNAITLLGFVTTIVIPASVLIVVKDTCNKKILSLAFVYVIVSVLTSQIFIFYRLINYFCYFFFIALAYSLRLCMKRKRYRPFIAIILIFMSITIIGKFNKEQYIRYAPYNSVFEKEYNKDRENEYIKLGNGMVY